MSDPYRYRGGAGGGSASASRLRRDLRPINDPATAAGMRGVHRDMRGNVIGGYTAEGAALGTKRLGNGLRGFAPGLAKDFEAAGGPPADLVAAAPPVAPAPPQAAPAPPTTRPAPPPTAIPKTMEKKSPVDAVPRKPGPAWREQAALLSKSVRPWEHPEAFGAAVENGKKAAREKQAQAAAAHAPPQRNALGGGLASWYELNPHPMPAEERLKKENRPLRRKRQAQAQDLASLIARSKSSFDASAAEAFKWQRKPMADL